MSKYKTRPIGEVFKYGKVKLQVVENNVCDECYFDEGNLFLEDEEDPGYCIAKYRDDRKNIIFKQVIE